MLSVNPASSGWTATSSAYDLSHVVVLAPQNTMGISLPSVDSAPVASALLAMTMVTVGNAGNGADPNTGSVYGAVSYSYQIGAYAVTGSEYTAFLNAVGGTDLYGLYSLEMNPEPWVDWGVAEISRTLHYGPAGQNYYTYAVLNSTGQRPITYVDWFDCARFSNWMSNGQPSGAQVSTTTENGTYNLNGATFGPAVAANATNPNTGFAPTFRIPLENEWYKAAYYSPNYGGTGIGGYYAYATQSDTAPGTTIGSSPNQANYNNLERGATDVGSFSGSGSFYGTFDQSGNVWQWNDGDGIADPYRNGRGGAWGDDSSWVSSSHGFGYPTYQERLDGGFRLASPAPAATVPSAPTAVVAVSGDAQLAVTWVAPASTGGSPITEYLVKYSSNGGASWTRFFPSSGLPITALSCTVMGLTNGTPYVIKVIAKNAVGISPPSANSAPATPATVPSAPTAVGAVSGDAQLSVTWAAPASTGGSPITNYFVKYSSNDGASWTRFFPSSGLPITALSCTVTGLTNGTPSNQGQRSKRRWH